MKQHTYERSRFKSVISFEALNQLDQDVIRSQSSPYPLTINAYFAKSKGANLLTQMILWKLRHDGHYAYRNASQGSARKMRDGSIKFVPGSQYAKGQGDVHAVIHGRSCFFEIKTGSDRVSEAQQRFKHGVEKSGGAYLVCRSFDEFLSKYNELLNN